VGRQALPTAENPRLQRVIQELFREGAAISGGTAGAVRHEVRTGTLVGGKSHIRKAIERRRQLQHILSRERLSPQDRSTAQQLLDDLSAALREAGLD
jgi:hypothetical protein